MQYSDMENVIYYGTHIYLFLFFAVYLYMYAFRTEGDEMGTGATQVFILHVSV